MLVYVGDYRMLWREFIEHDRCCEEYSGYFYRALYEQLDLIEYFEPGIVTSVTTNSGDEGYIICVNGLDMLIGYADKAEREKFYKDGLPESTFFIDDETDHIFFLNFAT